MSKLVDVYVEGPKFCKLSKKSFVAFIWLELRLIMLSTLHPYPARVPYKARGFPLRLHRLSAQQTQMRWLLLATLVALAVAEVPSQKPTKLCPNLYIFYCWEVFNFPKSWFTDTDVVYDLLDNCFLAR